MELTYTQTLIDTCPKPLQCSRCGGTFIVGEMIHEVPYDKINDDVEYKLVCHGCYMMPKIAQLFKPQYCEWCGKEISNYYEAYYIDIKGIRRLYCENCGKAIMDRI